MNEEREFDEKFIIYDAISGEELDPELIKEARRLEMENFRKHGVGAKAPIEECWKETSRPPIGVKWVDVNEGDFLNPRYRRRLVAKEIKKDKRDDLFCSHAIFWRRRKRCFHYGRAYQD